MPFPIAPAGVLSVLCISLLAAPITTGDPVTDLILKFMSEAPLFAVFLMILWKMQEASRKDMKEFTDKLIILVESKSKTDSEIADGLRELRHEIEKLHQRE